MTEIKKIRRTDLEKKEEDFLVRVLTGAFACSVAVGGQVDPAVHVAFFAFDQNRHEIIFHFSRHGQAAATITDAKEVCISVTRIGKLYTGTKAVDFGCEYESVMVYGKVEVLSAGEKMQALHFFFNKFFPLHDPATYEPFNETNAKEINVVRVPVAHWRGKAHYTPDKSTGSYYPPHESTLIPLIRE